MTTPNYYLPIMPYIIVKDAQGFLKFLKSVFNAEEKMIVPREDGKTIMHAEIAIGKAVIMFAEADDEKFKPFPCSMFIFVQEVDKIYHAAMQNSATSLQEPSDQDYGRSAGFMDTFGNIWWLTRPVK